MSGHRGFGLVVVGCALGAVLVLIAVALSWGHSVSLYTQFGGHVRRTSGSSPAGLRGTAFAALAGAAGLLAARGKWRYVVAALLVGLGAACLAIVVARAPGVSAAAVIAAVGGLLVVVAAGCTFWFARSWPGMGARYDAPRARPREETLWDALERGNDPT